MFENASLKTGEHPVDKTTGWRRCEFPDSRREIGQNSREQKDDAAPTR